MVVVAEVFTIDVLADVEIIVVGVIAIVLKFTLPVSYSVDVSSSDADVDLLIDALAAVILVGLTGIGIGMLADLNANVFTVVKTALEFPVSTPLEGFGRCAAFDWWPLALLDCDWVLQTWMPSNHV